MDRYYIKFGSHTGYYATYNKHYVELEMIGGGTILIPNECITILFEELLKGSK